MRSVSNRDIVQDRLQVLHIHVLLVAPLGTSYMAKSGTDKHEGRVSVRESPNHPSAAADFSIEPLHDIVGANLRPVFIWEITVG